MDGSNCGRSLLPTVYGEVKLNMTRRLALSATPSGALDDEDR